MWQSLQRSHTTQQLRDRAGAGGSSTARLSAALAPSRRDESFVQEAIHVGTECTEAVAANVKKMKCVGLPMVGMGRGGSSRAAGGHSGSATAQASLQLLVTCFCRVTTLCWSFAAFAP